MKLEVANSDQWNSVKLPLLHLLKTLIRERLEEKRSYGLWIGNRSEMLWRQLMPLFVCLQTLSSMMRYQFSHWNCALEKKSWQHSLPLSKFRFWLWCTVVSHKCLQMFKSSFHLVQMWDMKGFITILKYIRLLLK